MSVRGLVLCCLLGPAALAAHHATPVQDQEARQRQVFRAGTHFVRVDAYPSRGGRVLRGLTPNDFVVTEDGVPQAIEVLEFVEFEPWNPMASRRDPASLGDMYRLAADPRFRVFVLYFDFVFGGGRTNAADAGGWRDLGPAINEMLSRMLGPRDVFGVTSSFEQLDTLTLGQATTTAEAEVARLWQSAFLRPDDPILGRLRACRLAAGVLTRYTQHKVFADLEGLVGLLSAIRESRKNVIVFSDGWSLPEPNGELAASDRPPTLPPVGVNRSGRLTTRPDDTLDDSVWCQEQASFLSNIDFYRRWRDLAMSARERNVAFYTVSPGGVGAYDLTSDRTSSLLALTEETDGLSVAGTNDFRTGLRTITEDLAAYYELGYYTSNLDWDGRLRRIEVRLKDTGERVRARREYRAPTEAEMAAASAEAGAATVGGRESAVPDPLVVARQELARLDQGQDLFARVVRSHAGALLVQVELASGLVASAPWRNGAVVSVSLASPDGQVLASAEAPIDVGRRGALLEIGGRETVDGQIRLAVESGARRLTDRLPIPGSLTSLVGPALLFRARPARRAPVFPAAEPEFRRTERLHLEWRPRDAIDHYEARLLAADGSQTPVPVTVSAIDAADGATLVADISLASLAAADYIVELRVDRGPNVERQYTAIRVVR